MDEEIEPAVDPVTCIACESPNLHRRPRAVYFAVIALLIAAWGWSMGQEEAAFFLIAATAIFALVADRWVCDDCGETWK